MSVLIIGGEGQDGTILKSEFESLKIEYFVISKSGLKSKYETLVGPNNLDSIEISKFITKFRIEKIFFLAAFSLSSLQRSNVDYQTELASHSQVEILLKTTTDAVIKANVPIKFFYFSSSLVFGDIIERITELSPFNPNSLYGEHKIRCETLILEKFGNNKLVTFQIIYFFNHESCFRSSTFFSARLCQSILNHDLTWAKNELKNTTKDSFIDMGYAPQFMHLLIQLSGLEIRHEKILFSTSFTYSMRQFLDFAIQFSDMNGTETAYFQISNERLLSTLDLSSDFIIHGHKMLYKLIDDWKSYGS